MSGMGDGYVGTAQDAVRIRRLEKQREAERQKIQELKTKSASEKGQPGLLQFGSSTSEVCLWNLTFEVPYAHVLQLHQSEGFIRLVLCTLFYKWKKSLKNVQLFILFFSPCSYYLCGTSRCVKIYKDNKFCIDRTFVVDW